MKRKRMSRLKRRRPARVVKRNIEPHWELVTKQHPLSAAIMPVFSCVNNVKFQSRWGSSTPRFVFDDGFYIYKNPPEVIKSGVIHQGRYRRIETLFTSDIRSVFDKGYYDLVFLAFFKERAYIIKTLQWQKDNVELDISLECGANNIGPIVLDHVFIARLGKRGNKQAVKVIVEECLSPARGWQPLYTIIKEVASAKRKWFVKAYATLVATLHKRGILFGVDYFDHLYVNRVTKQVRLVDFGESGRYCDPKDLDDHAGVVDGEVEQALNNLKRYIYPKCLQDLFIDTYSAVNGSPLRHIRTDTVGRGGGN